MTSSSTIRASQEGLAARTSVRGRAVAAAPKKSAAVKRAELAVQASDEPLLIRATKGEKVERAPAWMMRQAGRYQASYRELAKKHPSFRERSETTELITQITLQPYESFKPDGIILFSDILTPLPAFGIDFDIDDDKGPLLATPITSKEGLSVMHPIELDKTKFVGEALTDLRKEVSSDTAVLGFVGSPWTLATYIVEGKSSRLYKTIKLMMKKEPEILSAILTHTAEQLTEYIRFQIDAGAHAIQIFDSWGGQLTPDDWDVFSKPYIQMMIDGVRKTHPGVPLTLYANGSGGLLERLASTGVDTVGLDWSVDMADGRKRLGDEVTLQGNVDPITLFCDEEAITKAVQDTVRKGKAGNGKHVLNLGHGVLVGTPEEAVGHFFETNRNTLYKDL